MTNEVTNALVLMAQRINNNNKPYWGLSDNGIWHCLLCNYIINLNNIIYYLIIKDIEDHGLIHLKESGLLAFL